MVKANLNIPKVSLETVSPRRAMAMVFNATLNVFFISIVVVRSSGGGSFIT